MGGVAPGRAASTRWLVAWGPVVLWVGLIFWLSSDTFSAVSTSSIVKAVLRWLLPDAPGELLVRLHGVVRKAAHVGVYAVLAVLTLRALHHGHGLRLRTGSAVALSFVLAVAALDESRQARSRARTGSIRDVGLDVAGGATALGLAGLLLAARRRAARAADGS